LIALLEIFDLRPADRDLDGDMFVVLAHALGRSQALVEVVEDLLIGHLVDDGAQLVVGVADVGIRVLDDRGVSTAGDPHLIERGDVPSFPGHDVDLDAEDT
jgi:hypothetical protein